MTVVEVGGRVLGWSQVNQPRQEVCPRAADGVWEEEATIMGWDESGGLGWTGRELGILAEEGWGPLRKETGGVWPIFSS